jgi:hypothetical protein
VQAVLGEPLETYLREVKHETLLFFATGDYTYNAPLIPQEYAQDTIACLPQALAYFVEGNHQTMLYGKGAMEIVGKL